MEQLQARGIFIVYFTAGGARSSSDKFGRPFE